MAPILDTQASLINRAVSDTEFSAHILDLVRRAGGGGRGSSGGGRSGGVAGASGGGDGHGGKKLKGPALIGVIVGITVLAIIIALVLFISYRRKKKAREEKLRVQQKWIG